MDALSTPRTDALVQAHGLADRPAVKLCIELERVNNRMRAFIAECAADKDDRISPGLKAKAAAIVAADALKT